MRFSNVLYFVVVAQSSQNASSQRFRRKFDFLPISSERIWGTPLRGPPNSSYNEWDPPAIPCTEIYSKYLEAIEIHAPEVGDLIYNTSLCILDSATAFQLQTIQTSTVLLGLVPVLVSTTGPSLTEIALISIQRPVLAVLLSLGAAAIFPTRTFSYYDDYPRDVLDRHQKPSFNVASHFLDKYATKDRRPRLAHFIFGTFQYVLAAAAVFNTLYTSWQLGTRSIFLLDCIQSFFPLLWSLLPLVVHALVCSSFHYHQLHTSSHTKEPEPASDTTSIGPQRKPQKRQDSGIRMENIPTNSATGLTSPQPSCCLSPGLSQNESVRMPMQPPMESEPAATHRWKLIRRELHLLPACVQPVMSARFLDNASLIVDLAHKLGTMLAFVHVIYGVTIFSSLLFISTADAAAIILRYLASVVVDRLLMAMELGAVKAEDKSAESTGRPDTLCNTRGRITW